MKMKLSESIKLLHREAETILINRLSGDWVRVSDEVLDIFRYASDNDLDLSQLLECVQSEDKDFIKDTAIKFSEMGIFASAIKQDRQLGSISYSTTHRCNLRCTHCIVDAETSSSKDYFSTREIEEILGKIIMANPQSIVITGGEPLTRNDFIETMSFCRNSYSGHLSLMTNGTLIDDELARFITSHFDSCNISLDGYDEKTCAQIRGSGVFDRAIQGITLLQSYGMDNISTSMVLSGNNTNYIDEYIGLNHKLGTKPMLRGLTFSGRAKKNEAMLKTGAVGKNPRSQKSYEAIVKACTCTAGFDQCVIEANGDIFPCNLFVAPRFKLGNICEIQNLKDLLIETCETDLISNCLIEYEPSKYEKCLDCDVSYFCWSCLYQILELSEDDFNDRCKAQKKYLEKVWE